MAIAPDQDLGFAGSSTTAITVSGTFPAGALILVAVGFATATAGQSISQSGSAFTNLFTRENSATNNLVYWYGYIKNWGGGALSTTFTLSGTGKDAGARLLSFTGADTTAPLLLSHDAGGAPKATTMDTGAATGTTNATDLLAGFFTWANTADIGGTITESGTPATGWTKTADSNGSSGNTPHGHAVFTYQILSSAATNPDAQITFTTPSAGVSYGASIATFKAASGTTHNLAASATGGASATAQLTVVHDLAASATGGASETAALTVKHNLAASAAGDASATALLTVTHPLAASATGDASATAALTVIHHLAASAAGGASATALLSTTHHLQASAAGGASATAALTVKHQLSASATAGASASAALTVQHLLVASASAGGAATALPTWHHALFASAQGNASASAALLILHHLAAQASAGGTATALLTHVTRMTVPVGAAASSTTPAGTGAHGTAPSGIMSASTVPAGTTAEAIVPQGTTTGRP